MNRDDVIRMAREAGLPSSELYHGNLERFAALVAAAEREACARIAEEPSATTYECTVVCGGMESTFTQHMPKDIHEIAKAIRARG